MCLFSFVFLLFIMFWWIAFNSLDNSSRCHCILWTCALYMSCSMFTQYLFKAAGDVLREEELKKKAVVEAAFQKPLGDCVFFAIDGSCSGYTSSFLLTSLDHLRRKLININRIMVRSVHGLWRRGCKPFVIYWWLTDCFSSRIFEGWHYQWDWSYSPSLFMFGNNWTILICIVEYYRYILSQFNTTRLFWHSI